MKTLILLIFIFLQTLAQEKETINLPDNSIYQIDQSWIRQDGKKIKLSELRGRPAIVTMAFTSCEYSCPLVIADLKKIENKLSHEEKLKIQIAIFSFDSQNDTPEHLKKYSEKKELNSAYWSMYNANEETVRVFANLLGVKYKKDKRMGFSHSNGIYLIDSKGVILYEQPGLGQDGVELLKALRTKAF